MNALVSILLAALQTALPLILKNSSATSSIVQTLVNAVPILIDEAQDLLPMVQNMIRALTSSNGVTDDDMATLEALNKQIDDAFEAAVAAKEAEV